MERFWNWLSRLCDARLERYAKLAWKPSSNCTDEWCDYCGWRCSRCGRPR